LHQSDDTTIYIYSGHQVIAAYDNGAVVGSPTREYIYGSRQRLAKIEANSTVYYHHDHLSVRVTTDSSGNPITQKGHYPFGESWYQTGTASTNTVFTSYEHDSESNNDYALAREYVNRLGRFSALDPLSGNTSDPQSLNRYAYATNDPIDLLDPEGEYDCSDGGCDFGGGGFSCSIDGVSVNCGRIFGGGGFPGFSEFELAGIAATPTGSHWELAPCEGGDGCVHNWTEFEVFEYGNSSLLFFLAAGGSGGGGGGSNTSSGPANKNRNCTPGSASARQYVAATAEVALLTGEFASGLGAGNQTFGPNTATSQVLAQSAGVQEVLGAYLFTGQTSGLYTFGASGAYVAGGNPVAQFVGSFRYTITPGAGGINLSIMNTTSVKSLTYDRGPQYQRGSFPTPGGNTHQTYNIFVPCKVG